MTAAFAAAALLLVIGGAAKLMWPGPAAEAMGDAGLPSSPNLVRVMAGTEAVLGTAALLTGVRPLAALVGAAYLAFAAFVVLAMRRGGAVRSCGCFGSDDAPPGPIHLAVDLILAAVAIGAAVRGVESVADAISVPYVIAVAVLTYVGYASLTALPKVVAERRAQPKATRAFDIDDLAVVGVGHRTVLVFLSSTCLTCREIWPRLAPLGDAKVVAVTKGPDVEDAAKVEALAPDGIDVVMSTEAWDRYGVTVAPVVVVVDGETGGITEARAIRSWADVSSSSRP